MSIAAGSLTRKITIEHPVDTVDDYNQAHKIWLPLLRVWGRPLTSTGMASVRALMDGVPLVPGQYSWRIRYRPEGITSAMRINYQDKFFFDIRELRHDFDRHEYTDLVCELGGNDG